MSKFFTVVVVLSILAVGILLATPNQPMTAAPGQPARQPSSQPYLGNGSWALQDSPTSVTLRAVSAYDQQNVWAVGGDDAGTIVRTTDGGQTWIKLTSAAPRALTAVQFVSETEGWVGGEAGLIWHTTDGGFSWEIQSSPTGSNMTGIEMINNQTGWFTTRGGSILHTIDGGQNWIRQDAVPRTAGMLGISAVNPLEVWAAGNAGQIVHSTNAGSDWFYQDSGSGEDFNAIQFVDALHGYAGGNNFRRTTNGGINWLRSDDGAPPKGVQGMAFLDVNYGWMVGDNGMILVTHDGLQHWQTYDGPGAEWRGISFADPIHGWAVGTAGRIMFYTEGCGHSRVRKAGRAAIPFGTPTFLPMISNC